MHTEQAALLLRTAQGLPSSPALVTCGVLMSCGINRDACMVLSIDVTAGEAGLWPACLPPPYAQLHNSLTGISSPIACMYGHESLKVFSFTLKTSFQYIIFC